MQKEYKMEIIAIETNSNLESMVRLEQNKDDVLTQMSRWLLRLRPAVHARWHCR